MFLEIKDRPITTQPPTKPKAKVSLKCLIGWLETKSGPYNITARIIDCPLYHFARSAGFDHETSYHMSYLMGESPLHGDVIFKAPHTYEAALKRARAV